MAHIHLAVFAFASLLVAPAVQAAEPAPLPANAPAQTVILMPGGAGCTAENGFTMKAFIESPDGGVTEAPPGLLEITDVTISVHWLPNTDIEDVTVTVQNRLNPAKSHSPLSLRIGGQIMGETDGARKKVVFTNNYINPRGTQHFSLGTGFFASPRAYICIKVKSDRIVLDDPGKIRMRGKLYPAPPTVDPQKAPMESKAQKKF